MAVKRLLKEAETEFGNQAGIVYDAGPDDPAWEEQAITHAPVMAEGDLVKFVGLVPTRGCLIGALRDAGLE